MDPCPPASAGGQEPTQDLVERAVRQSSHLVVGAVLDRMGHEHRVGVGAQRGGLRRRGVHELARGDHHAREAAALQVDDVVHTARRARASIGECLDHQVALRADLVAEIDGRRLRERRLREPSDGDTPVGELRLEPVEEHVAARLGDVEEPDRAAVERRRTRRPLARRRRQLSSGVEQDTTVRGGAHVLTSRVTGWLPPGPLIQPPMMAENSPAPPPACTIRSPSSRSFGTVIPATPSGRPSVIPPAPRTTSSPSSCRSASSSSRRRAFDQPPSRNTRPCSGETTRIASKPSAIFGCGTAGMHAASERASDSDVRLSWSTTPRTPSPAKSVTADESAGRPRSTCNASHGEPASSSAKQNVYLPGLPSVARSISPGRPPPTLRTTSCNARPMVALARLPWPRALIPEFIPIARATGPFTMTTGPEKYVVASSPWTLNSSVHAASTVVSTTGRYSGLQPAMTALMATFSTEHSTRSGGTTATRSSGARVVPVSMRATRSGVGGTTGSPSLQPRSNAASMSSSWAPRSTRRECRRAAPAASARAAATLGSSVREPQPGRYSGRP